MQINEINALVFDVFGTVVDWRMSIAREGKALARRKNITHVDWLEFADEWRAGYGPSMNRVRQGELPWTRIDDLHRMILDELLNKYGIEGLTEDEKRDFNKAWHRLDPWPDSLAGPNTYQAALHHSHAVQWQRRAIDQYGKVRQPSLGLHPVRRARPPLQARPRNLPHGRRHARPETIRSVDDRRAQERPQGRASAGTQDCIRLAPSRTRPLTTR